MHIWNRGGTASLKPPKPHLSASDQVRNLNRGQMDDDGPWGRTEKVENTLPETNIAPGNRPSQKETSIPTIHF